MDLDFRYPPRRTSREGLRIGHGVESSRGGLKDLKDGQYRTQPIITNLFRLSASPVEPDMFIYVSTSVSCALTRHSEFGLAVENIEEVPEA